MHLRDEQCLQILVNISVFALGVALLFPGVDTLTDSGALNLFGLLTGGAISACACTVAALCCRAIFRLGNSHIAGSAIMLSY